MKTKGKVIEINSGSVIVEVKRKGACGDHCAHCNGCDAQTICVEADCSLAVELGDWVYLGSDQNAVLSGLFILFILPILLPLAVYAIMFKTGFGWLFALLALLLSLFYVLHLNKNEQFLKRSKPYILDIIKKEYEE